MKNKYSNTRIKNNITRLTKIKDTIDQRRYRRADMVRRTAKVSSILVRLLIDNKIILKDNQSYFYWNSSVAITPNLAIMLLNEETDYRETLPSTKKKKENLIKEREELLQQQKKDNRPIESDEPIFHKEQKKEEVAKKKESVKNCRKQKWYKPILPPKTTTNILYVFLWGLFVYRKEYTEDAENPINRVST